MQTGRLYYYWRQQQKGGFYYIPYKGAHADTCTENKKTRWGVIIRQKTMLCDRSSFESRRHKLVRRLGGCIVGGSSKKVGYIIYPTKGRMQIHAHMSKRLCYAAGVLLRAVVISWSADWEVVL